MNKILSLIIEEIEQKHNNGKDLSYNELVFLQEHQEFIKKYYPNNETLWEISGIPEEEWHNR